MEEIGGLIQMEEGGLGKDGVSGGCREVGRGEGRGGLGELGLRELKALGQYISGIRLLNLNTAVTEQVNGNSTT